MPSLLTSERRERLTERLALAEARRPMVEGSIAPLVVVNADDLRALLADSAALERAEVQARDALKAQEAAERERDALREQVARLRAALEAFVFALGTEGSLCNQPAWRELRNAAQAALRSTAPEGEEGCAR